jgi:hypothetical protein
MRLQELMMHLVQTDPDHDDSDEEMRAAMEQASEYIVEQMQELDLPPHDPWVPPMQAAVRAAFHPDVSDEVLDQVVLVPVNKNTKDVATILAYETSKSKARGVLAGSGVLSAEEVERVSHEIAHACAKPVANAVARKLHDMGKEARGTMVIGKAQMTKHNKEADTFIKKNRAMLDAALGDDVSSIEHDVGVRNVSKLGTVHVGMVGEKAMTALLSGTDVPTAVAIERCLKHGLVAEMKAYAPIEVAAASAAASAEDDGAASMDVA